MPAKKMEPLNIRDFREWNLEHSKKAIAYFKEKQKDLPGVIMEMLKRLEHLPEMGVTQLHHALETATRAYRDKASDEMVLCALVHDIGKAICQVNHAAIGAEITKVYVSKNAYQILLTHQEFQSEFFYRFRKGFGANPRDSFLHEPWYQQAVEFSDNWDSVAFNPDFKVKPLGDFEPLVRKFFGDYKGFEPNE